MKIIPALIKKNIQNSGDTGKQIYKNSKGHPITVSLMHIESYKQGQPVYEAVWVLMFSKKSGCEVLIWYKKRMWNATCFLVNLREYCWSLVQCCQQVSHFTGDPRAQPVH